MRARFQVHAVFTIEGRGIALQGRIVEGRFQSGMALVIPGLNDRLVIKSIEDIRDTKSPLDSIGLLLNPDGRYTADNLRLLTEGKIVDVE